MQLFDCLGTLALGEGDLAEFIQFMNKYVGFDVYGEAFGIGLADQASGKLSFNVGVVHMNESKISMTLNLRYPVTFKKDDMMKPFRDKIETAGINIENF